MARSPALGRFFAQTRVDFLKKVVKSCGFYHLFKESTRVCAKNRRCIADCAKIWMTIADLLLAFLGKSSKKAKSMSAIVDLSIGDRRPALSLFALKSQTRLRVGLRLSGEICAILARFGGKVLHFGGPGLAFFAAVRTPQKGFALPVFGQNQRFCCQNRPILAYFRGHRK